MYDAAGAATAATLASDQGHATQDHDSAHVDEAAPAAHANAQDLDGAEQDTSTLAGEAVSTAVSEIVFMDGRLPDIASLTPREGVQFIVLDPSRDGLAQVTEALTGYSGLSAIHFVGHGESGAFAVGSTSVDSATLATRAGEIANWSAALGADADIMIWGCDVGSMPSGEALVASLSSLTGADVAASTDATGATGLGGDWVLESSSGEIKTATPFQATSIAAWDHLLDPPSISGPTDTTIRVAEPSSINAPGADRTSLAGWQFQSNVAGSVTVTAVVSDTSVGTILNSDGRATQIAGGWSFTGDLAEANAWLDSLSFVAADAERGIAAGSTNISLTIQDADGGIANRSIAVEVTPSNDPSTIDNVATAVTEGGSKTLDASVLAPLDPEVSAGTQIPSQIVYRLTADPQFGYLALNGQRIGVGSIFTQQDVIDGRLVYHHTAAGADQNISDTFDISLNDGATPQASSDTATITLNITPVNQGPTVSGIGAVYEGQPANASLNGAPQSQVGEFIAAGGGGDPGDSVLQVRLTALPQHGTLYFTGTAVIGGVSQDLSNHQVTASDISAGFVFDYAARAGLTYANDGIDAGAAPNGRPPNDSFGVEVIDGGGGTGIASTTAGTIQLTIRAVNDDPVWVESSTRTATVSAPSGDPATDYKVTLTTAMLNVTDIDSSAASITFIVTSQTGLDQGRLVYIDGGGQASLLPEGGTFTLADVQAGRIQYWQMAGASAGETDTFNFQIADNALGPRWNSDGTQFERIGGVYTGPSSADALRTLAFTINLAQTPTGVGGSLPTRNTVAAGSSSTFAGTNASGTSYGSLLEGGSVTLTNGSGGQPGLNYTADGIDPSQVVFTVLGFDNAGPEWNGTLQRQLSDGTWVDLGVYDTFTQADLNDGKVRFQHDGGEDFESSVRLQASAGVLVSDGQGGFTTDQWDTSFTFYVKPINDAPVATGSSSNVIDEGETVAITTDFLNFDDPDDAVSEAYPENAATLSDGSTNYAANNGADFTFTITTLPTNGRLEYFDGTSWQVVTTGTVLQTSWITDDAGTTRLRYAHDGGEARSDAFQAQATDRWSATSNSASVGFVITNVNDAPQIAPDPTQSDPTGILPGTSTAGTSANNPLTVIQEGSFTQLTAAMLQAVDSDSSAEQVQYRITTAPAHGRIAYSTDGANFVTIGVGSSFTQADLAAGRIYYLSNGDEPSGNNYPAAPDDKFVFTLADGAAEQAANEFWIYVQPTNDAPVVTAPSGPIPVTDTLTQVPGFIVSDPDMPAQGATETDFLQVTVRLLKADGTAFTTADYALLGGVDIVVSASGAAIDGDHNGLDDYLVLRGTQQQINDALSTLTIQFKGDRDEVYRVQVIADDRVRDASGNLVDRDAGTGGVQPGGNGGGILNEPETPFTGTPQTVLATEFDWYADPVPTTGGITGNIAAAFVTIRASMTNDPATMTSGNDAATTYEDQATPIGSQINFTVSDAESGAFETPVTLTLSVPSGVLNVAASSGTVTVSGRDTGTLVLTGTAAEIQTLLNSSLTYRSAQNVNHDLNGAADGDVTLTVSFSDSGSNLGTGQSANNPSPLSIALTIVPVNDAPTVSAGTGTVVIGGPTAVPGFSVGDLDLGGDGEAGLATGETDFVEVTVRITSSSGVPLSALQHQDVNFSSSASLTEGANFQIDDTYNGSSSALVIRGTRDQVNAYLAGLQVEFLGDLANGDDHYRVEVIADDRLRDVTGGSLTSGANGGSNNDGSGGTAAVPTTEIDPYAAVPGGLTANVDSDFRDLFPSADNDPAHIDLSGALITPEGSGIVQLSGITVTDEDALSDSLTTTVSLPNGFTFASVNGSSSYPGVGTGSIQITGSLDQINAALNSIRIQLPDVTGDPAASDWNGPFDVTIVVNDGGNNGDRPGSLAGDTNDPSGNPGDFEYADGTSAALVTTRTFTFSVTPINDAPQVIGGNVELLPATPEDTTQPNGTTVDDLFGHHFSDPIDPIPGGSTSNSFAGVAIVGLSTNAPQGEWQYHNGTTWVAIGNRDASNALILTSGTQVRFVPTADFHGTPNTMTVRLMENGDGGNGSTAPAAGAVVNLSGGAAVGGSTRYSADVVTLSTTVQNVNDRPSINNGSLLPVNEDAANPGGATVTDLFGGGYGDATDDQSAVAGGGNAKSPLGGIAIVGNAADPAEGTWEYSTDGGVSWSGISTSVSDTSAVLLSADALIRFVPAGDFNGTPGGLTVRASDVPVSAATGQDISGTVGDQTSTWSEIRDLSTSVVPLNDAPVLGGISADPVVQENDQTGTGVSIPPTALLVNGSANVSDLDLTTTDGLASGTFGAGSIEVSLGASFLPGDVLSVTGALPGGVTVSAGMDGTLTITLDADTTLAEVNDLLEQISYSSTSDNPTNYGNDTTRSFSILVRDGNNAQAGGNAGGPASLASAPITGTITLQITNDPPVAVDDTNAINENTNSVGGNVVAGIPGGGQDTDPDTAVLTVTDVRFGGTGGAVGQDLDGSYGSLVLNADGSYTYLLDNANPAVNALKDGETLTEVFTYTISDGTSTATATLTITINGTTDGTPTIAVPDDNGAASGEAEVFERGLGDSGDASETTSGSITVGTPDGIASITVGGRNVSLAELQALGTTPVVIDTGEGTLTLTGFTITTTNGSIPTSGEVHYSYTLKAAQNQPGATESLDQIAVSLTDAGGSAASTTLTVRIVDDVPVASADSVEIPENTSTITGNVVGSGRTGDVADDLGADGGTVTGLVFGGNGQSLGTPVTAAYGQLTLNPDGSYSYVLDNANPLVDQLRPGETLVEVFTYTLTDGDGDVSSATLTITINGSNDAPVITNPNHTVTGAEDGVITFTPADFASSDVDPGDLPEDVRIVNLPTRGTLYLDGQALAAGSTVSLADVAAGKLTYRPAPDGNGPAYSSFGYQVGDGSDYSATGTMGIDIAPRNDTPTVSGPTSATVLLDTPLLFDGGTGTNHAPTLSIDDLIDFSETGAADFFTLTLSVSNGVISIGDPNGAITGEGSGRSLTLTGTREAINAALATLTYRSDRTYFGPDQLVVSVDDHLNAGTGEGAQPGTASHVVDITVAPPPVTNPEALESPDVQERADEYWGGLPYDRDRNVFDDLYGDRDYLEGRPIDRYTVTWQPVSQQMLFRQYGNGPLFYEARLGRDLPLPSWISFDPSTQIVTAVPDAQVKPGVYTVRVVARDLDGNEAESVLTIHVLRDIKKSFDTGAAELPPREKPAPAETSPAHQEGSAPQTPPEEENPGDANDGSENSGSDDPGANAPDADDAVEQQTLNSPAAHFGDGPPAEKSNNSLTNLLLALGPAGRMIEAANFIESLANEGGTAR